MKTTNSLKALLVTALVGSATVSGFAGPGPQYWANLNKSPAQANDATPAATIPICPGSKDVAVTVMKPSWQNGRGPLKEVQIGTKRICTVCPVTTTETKGWANGRGPKTQTDTVSTVSTGAPHTCTVTCPTTKA